MQKITLITGLIFLILIASFGGFFCYMGSKYNYNEIDKENLGIDESFKEPIVKYVETSEKKTEEKKVDISGIKTFALFGLDRRTSDENNSRSDSIMTITINFYTKEIKITSFMRDMLVNIEGYGLDKLNHAYSYGGPELAIKTLNQNFGLNIQDYAAVDFLMLEDIIDDIGGVIVEVKESEVDLINKYMEEIAVKNNKSFDKLTTSGLVQLDGGQAVAYSRIRAEGNGDYERTERQRTVLSAMIDKLSNVDIKSLPAVISTVLDNTETSVKLLDAISLGKDYLAEDFGEIQTQLIPREGSFTAGIQKNGMWAMRVNFEKEKEFLREWIYGISEGLGESTVGDTYTPSNVEVENTYEAVKIGL